MTGHGFLDEVVAFCVMSPTSCITLKARFYILVVAAAGFAAITESVYDLLHQPISYQWLILAILTLFSGSATVKLPSVPATISISETFVFASALLFGPAAATLTVALDALVMSCWMWRRHRQVHRVLFNVGVPALSIWLASKVFFAWSGLAPLIHTPAQISDLLLPLGLLTAIHFLLNSWLIAFAVAFERRTSAYLIWRKHFLWLSLNYFGGASVAALLVVYSSNLNFTFLIFIIPLLLIIYFTFKSTMARAEDANRHLQQLNSLHLATIETLAMAIDAKDQITHGHIRRVQRYAVGLATAMGLKDDAQIKAVEAAALLHDMGKLAVPEYILNKPGKLTVAEFDKMKRHASVGADILSAIDFPYPVVPIVRHHHEHWDGSGYPAGLKGTEIPIGARILAVVDCFDALTSDRPYRPRLADSEALLVLSSRRGTMYDPLVVDTFLRVHQEIGASLSESCRAEERFSYIAEAPNPAPDALVSSGLDNIAASTEETLVLYDLTRALGRRMNLLETVDVVSTHLRRNLPISLSIFFQYNGEADELLAVYASGEGRELLIGLKMAVGQRLSGWVAANRRTILNSDPLLDLGEIVRLLPHRPRSCLSVPIVAKTGPLAGVLSLYSPGRDAFTENQRHLVEEVVRQVGEALRSDLAMECANSATLVGSLAALPRLDHLSRLFNTERVVTTPSEGFGLVLITAPEHFSAPMRQEVLSRALEAARRCLREADIIFRHGEEDVIAVMSNSDRLRSETFALQIRNAVEGKSNLPGTGPEPLLAFGSAAMPEDGISISALIAAARKRLAGTRDSYLSGEPTRSIH